MAKIDRHTGNLIPFALNAPSVERKVFGGITESNTLDDNLTVLFGEGWADVTNPTLWPKLRDFNSTMFTATQLIAYIIQRGIPEYHAQQEYFIGSMCSFEGVIHISLTDANTGNLLTDPLYWRTLISENSITDFELAPDAVRNINLLDNAVSLTKFAHGTPLKLFGFDGTGAPVEAEPALGVDQTWVAMTPTPNIQVWNFSGRPVVFMVADEFTPVSDNVNGLPIDEVRCRTFVIPDNNYFQYTESYDTVLQLI